MSTYVYVHRAIMSTYVYLHRAIMSTYVYLHRAIMSTYVYVHRAIATCRSMYDMPFVRVPWMVTNLKCKEQFKLC